MGLFGIVLGLGVLMYFAYRGFTVLLLAPLGGLLAVALARDAPLLASYTQVFMPAAGQFTINYVPLFLLGAVFGKLMDDQPGRSATGRSVSSVRTGPSWRS